MQITSLLGLRYVQKNKKRTLATIFGIIIVTILVTMVITLLSSYQQYLVRSVRAKRNWELELKNITYADSQKVANHENVKEISIIHNLGFSKEDISKTNNYKIKLDLREYSENALKNANFKIIEGRLPQNSNEIIVTNFEKNIRNDENNTKLEVGQNIIVTINEKEKEYLVVGKVAYTDFDVVTFSKEYNAGAITFLDTNEIANDDIVDVSILTNNIQKIYKTGNDLINELKMDSSSEEATKISEKELFEQLLTGVQKNVKKKNASLEYNEELLNYECVIDNGGSEFARTLFIIGIFAIIIFGIFSIVMIKASFNMSYMDRIKELGVLTSIGMNKKQRNKMIRAETRILGGISIPIGIGIGLGLSYILIKLLNNWIKLIKISSIIVLDDNIELYMKIPIIAIILIIVIVWIFVKLSSVIPMRKINKISPINAIKNIKNEKITAKQVKYPKIIEKIFKEEGILAYKNIRRNKEKYKTVVYSLSVSLILFLSVHGIITNIYKSAENSNINMYDDYIIEIEEADKTVTIDIKKIEDIMKYLKENKLVDNCYANLQSFNTTNLELNENQISEPFKKMMDKDLFDLRENNNGKINIPLRYYWILGDAYNEILKKAGVTELKENEIIITNNISEKTKFGNNINITNLKVGDKITLNIAEWKGQVVEREFTIVGIVDDFEPYINGKYQRDVAINELMSPETAINLIKEFDYVSYVEIRIKTDQNRAAKIDEYMPEIKKMYDENGIIMGVNRLPTDLSNEKTSYKPREDLIRIDTEKISHQNERNIIRTLLYSFVGIVAIIITVNTYNTIYYSIILRKKEFASLKSIGMSEKQLRKMTILEGIFYGIDSLIFGVGISIISLYIIYLIMINHKVYLFNISWFSIIISTLIMYCIIFFSIIVARKKLKNTNIVDEIRNENI